MQGNLDKIDGFITDAKKNDELAVHSLGEAASGMSALKDEQSTLLADFYKNMETTTAHVKEYTSATATYQER